MYNTAAKVKKLTYFSRLNKSFKSDLYWWHMFINHWNGISLLRSATTFPDYHIYTDASGSWGFGAVFAGFWFQLPWPMEWSSVNIMAKELVLIIISCTVWGPLLKQRSTEFHCDNQGLVAVINKGSSKDAVVMHLLRCLWFSPQFLTSTSQQLTSLGSLIMQQTCCQEIRLQNSWKRTLTCQSHQHHCHHHSCASYLRRCWTRPPQTSIDCFKKPTYRLGNTSKLTRPSKGTYEHSHSLHTHALVLHLLMYISCLIKNHIMQSIN